MTFCRISFQVPGVADVVRAATVVAVNTLLTAAHGIDDGQTVTIDTGEGTRGYRGTVRHCILDLAIVVADEPMPGVPLDIGSQNGATGTLEGWDMSEPATGVRPVTPHLHYEANGGGLSGYALVQRGELVGVQSRHVTSTTFAACLATDALECIGSQPT